MKRFKYAFQTTMIALLCGVVFLTSCGEDEEDSDSNGSTTGTATIKGKVEADMIDSTKGSCTIANTNNMVVLSSDWIDKKVTIRGYIDGEDLVRYPDDTINYQDKYYSTTVDSEGRYTLKVDAPKNGTATFNFTGVNFVAKKTRVDTCNNTTEEVDYKYELNIPATAPTVRVGETDFVDLDFSDSKY